MPQQEASEEHPKTCQIYFLGPCPESGTDIFLGKWNRLCILVVLTLTVSETFGSLTLIFGGCSYHVTCGRN